MEKGMKKAEDNSLVADENSTNNLDNDDLAK